MLANPPPGDAYMRTILLLTLALMSACACAEPIDEARLKDLARHTWYDRADDRYIMIIPDKEYGDITINAWSGNPEYSIDAYRVYLENGRLVFPEDISHHAPRCEMILKGRQLIEVCSGKIPGVELEAPPTRSVFTPLKDKDN